MENNKILIVDFAAVMRDQSTDSHGLIGEMTQIFEGRSIISISSYVMRGAVGNRAITFALSALGYPVWSVPTVVLPWHPGQGPSTRLSFDEAQFAHALEDLAKAKWRDEVVAIITGYFASAAQVRAAAALISALRAERPDLIYLCDPVIGDRGGLYVSQDIAEEIRNSLLPLASIVTPNRFELAWLTEKPTDTNQQILDAFETLSAKEAVITSAHAMMVGAIANLHVNAGKMLLAEHRELERVPNGLGDLFSALFLARRVAGETGESALKPAVAGVFQAVARAVEAGSDELMLEGEQDAFRAPHMNVQIRSLVAPRGRRKQH